MARLCSNCINNCPQNNDRKKSTDPIPGPICQALRNLQAKIKILENQRNDEAGKFQINDCDQFFDDNNNNQNNVNADPTAGDAINQSTIIVPDEQQQQRASSTSLFIDIEEVSCQLEKSLAGDALKMAERRCALLESQLVAMKRLFLRRLSMGSEPVTETAKPLKHAKKSTLKETFNEAKLMTDVDSLYSFNYDGAEDMGSETDSDLLNLSKTCFESRESQKDESYDKGYHSYKGKSTKNVSNIERQWRNNAKFKSTPCSIAPGRVDQPFILGGSTSTSHNANTKKYRPRKNVIMNESYRAMKATSNCNNGRQLAESSINNLRSIYSELCCEYEQLLNKKVKILDIVARVKGKELLEQRQLLNEITQFLPLKRQQIHKMKTLINNFNDTFRCDYANIRWDN